MKKFLINTFALIGFVTFIVLACSVASDDDEPINPNPQTTDTNDYGKYQMTAGSSHTVFHVLDTETGEVRSYYNPEATSGNGIWYGSFDLKHTTETF
tara:strand:+ start:488 stop:778 length:291 start_codon:yes stop_codon:yes gene_type:complete